VTFFLPLCHLLISVRPQLVCLALGLGSSIFFRQCPPSQCSFGAPSSIPPQSQACLSECKTLCMANPFQMDSADIYLFFLFQHFSLFLMGAVSLPINHLFSLFQRSCFLSGPSHRLSRLIRSPSPSFSPLFFGQNPSPSRFGLNFRSFFLETLSLSFPVVVFFLRGAGSARRSLLFCGPFLL